MKKKKKNEKGGAGPLALLPPCWRIAAEGIDERSYHLLAGLPKLHARPANCTSMSLATMS